MTDENRAILVVDDEKQILELFTMVISEWASHRALRVLPAGSAVEALTILERESTAIDLIVSDLNMPGMRGGDFLIEAKRRFPDITTMIVSGFADMEELRKIIAAGTFSYLLKPCEPAALLAEVEKSLEVARLRSQNRRYERMIRDELTWAGQLQRTLLHAEPSQDPGLSISVTYLPLPELQCGGDYYEIVPLSPNRSMFLIGDVGGHGIRAALIAAMLKAFVSGRGPANEPRGLLEHLNARVCTELKRLPDVIITFVACMVDTSSLELRCANAGHLPAFILREETAIRVLPAGMGLGFRPDARYEETTVRLARGDTIVLCTDGLLEGLSMSPAEAETRFSRILLSCAGEKDFNAAVVDRARQASAQTGFSDDAALLSVRLL